MSPCGLANVPLTLVPSCDSVSPISAAPCGEFTAIVHRPATLGSALLFCAWTAPAPITVAITITSPAIEVFICCSFLHRAFGTEATEATEDGITRRHGGTEETRRLSSRGRPARVARAWIERTADHKGRIDRPE